MFFGFFPTKSEQTAIQQSHIINPLLTSFAWSVRESIAFGFYRTDLAPSSLGLYENLRQYFPVQTSHSVNKSLIYIYTLDPENFDREQYIYVRHFEICYVILRTQTHHMLYIYAKVVMRRPNPKAYGHLVDVLSFKWTI